MYLFTVYIDDLLISLKRSSIGCHVDMGALAYTDDITLSCTSIKKLNLMLNTCNELAIKNKSLCNCKKCVCIKYGFKEKESEIAKLGGIKIEMIKSFHHLRNYFDCTINEQTDSKIKKGQFIGSVYKLTSNFQHLQRNVLVRLFKSDC